MSFSPTSTSCKTVLKSHSSQMEFPNPAPFVSTNITHRPELTACLEAAIPIFRTVDTVIAKAGIMKSLFH
jgi:hypothetical protein